MRDINPSGDKYPGTAADRSIRNIPVGGHHHPSRRVEEETPRPGQKRRRPARFWLWVLAAVLVFALFGVLISTVFAGATVTVHPRQVTVEAPATLEARLLAPVGTLEYKTVTATRDMAQSIASNGTQQVSRQASGQIAISNAFSTEPQRLIANTRFEAAGGKIYRIRDSVTVPGMVGGKPGTAMAVVYADSPGASYNTTGSTSFTIPGFKGDPRYSKFTAVSVGAISGGFVGAEAAVAPADLQKAKDEMQKRLDADIRMALLAAIPEGYGLLPGAVTVNYSEIGQKAESGGKVTLSQSATALGAMVNGPDLGTAIAHAKVAGYKGEALSLVPDHLTVTASSTREGVISIVMTGSATLVWQFDPGALRQNLLGKPKTEFQKILSSFAPAIDCTEAFPCDVRIRPFWTSNFPTDANDIKIVTKTGE